jgi:hypothetical protein
MADNVPLIFDAQNNRIKELPIGNNLDLTGSGIVNADSMFVNGRLTVNSIIINSQSLSTVAFSNDYEDLDNTPTGFTGDYNDLTNKPTVPGILKNLNDVSGDSPVEGDALIYDALEGLYRPKSIINQTDLDALTLGSLNNVITVGNVTDRFLKFTAGAWRPSKVQYAEVQDTPTAVSAFTNDLGFLTQQDLESGIEITPTGDLTGSVFSDDSTLLVDGVNSLINLNETVDDNVVPKEANSVDLGSPEKPFNNIYLSASGIFSGDYAELSNLPTSITDFGVSDGTAGQVLTTDGSGNFAFQDAGDQIGNFTLSASTIDTDDSSAITITPAVVMSSDLTVENDVLVNGSVTASSFISTGDGDPEFLSQTDITLSATTRVTISSSPLKLATFTTIERDALTSEFGEMVYNSDVGKMQGYVEDSGSGTPGWVDLH